MDASWGLRYADSAPCRILARALSGPDSRMAIDLSKLHSRTPCVRDRVGRPTAQVCSRRQGVGVRGEISSVVL